MTPGETKYARALVRACLGRGCVISVWEGGDWAIKRSANVDAVMKALASTDMDVLVVRQANGHRLGSFTLIYGNNDDELIADCSATAFCDSVWEELEPLRRRLEK